MEGRLRALMLRGALGGALMGLANLVPGISGGTMLLAAGVYPAFISATAEVTTLRFRPRPLILLATVCGSAAVAILLLAGPTRSLVIERRWVMYSLFIGLTLGGLPLVWRLARPATPGLWAGAVAGFLPMLAMAAAPPVGGGADGSLALLVLAGVFGAGAMILPGVSGGYLLLLLGQYLPILGAVDQLKSVLTGLAGGLDAALLRQSLGVLVPVGVGVVIGVVGISNALRWLLDRFTKPTLGFLLGLLLGAVIGLWPFQEGRPPEPGSVHKGRLVTAESLPTIDPEDYPLARYAPTGSQLAGSLGLLLLGLGITAAIDRIGGGGDPSASRG